MRLSDTSWTPEVQRHRIFERAFFLREVTRPRRMAVILEARQAPRFRFVRVDRNGFVVAATGMGDMIDAAAQRTPAPEVEDIEREGGVDIDRRLQRGGQLPRLEAYASDVFAGPTSRGQRNAAPVAGDDMATGIESLGFHLQ